MAVEAMFAFLLFGLFFLFVLVLAIAIPVWVYKDAQKHNPEEATLWAIIAFFGGILGLIVYLVVGREND